MSGKTIFEPGRPVTKNREAVVELLSYFERPAELLPKVVDLGAVKLVLSNKNDVFYTTTARACSCPSVTYRPGNPFKHQLKFFPAEKKNGAGVPEPVDSIRPTGKWPGGYNVPVEEALQEVV